VFHINCIQILQCRTGKKGKQDKYKSTYRTFFLCTGRGERDRKEKITFFSVSRTFSVTPDCRLTKPVSAVGIAASRLFFLPKTLCSGRTNYKSKKCLILKHCTWVAEHVFFLELGSNIGASHVNILE